MIEFALLANVIVFTALLVFLARRGYINVYSGLFIYFAFHFVAFVQRPIVVYLFDIRSEFIFMRYMPTEEVMVETIFISNVGLLSFVLGYLVSLRFTPILPTFILPQVSAAERKSFALAFFALAPLIFYSFYLVLTMREGLVEALDEIGSITMTIDPATGTPLFQDTSAYIVFARNMALPFASCVILIGRGRWWSFVPLALCAFISLQTGGRWQFVISAIVGITAALYFKRRLVPQWHHFIIIVSILAAFVILGQHRDLIVKFLTTGELDLQIDLRNSSFGAHPDFANFDFLTYVVGKVPEVSRTWSYFTQYLGLFTQPIPRVLWPDKPVNSPIVWVNLQAYGSFASRTTSLVGDGWISFGYVGVVVTLASVGAFYGWLYKRFCQPYILVYFYCAYFWMDALLIQWARDGGYKISDFFFFCLTPILLAYGIKRTFSLDLAPERRTVAAFPDRGLPPRYD
jgi:oligosaccharide repeat unit polymerase